MKKGNAIFAFTLKNKEGQTESWYIDLKEKGEVVKGQVEKADGELSCLFSLLRPSDSVSNYVAHRSILHALPLLGRPC